jgi:hypothetical protein
MFTVGNLETRGVGCLMHTRTVRAALGCALSLIVSAAALADPIIVTPTNNANTLANALNSAGSGITINSATYTGAALASGTYTGGTGVVGIDTGIVLTSGNATFVSGPNNSTQFSVDNGAAGDAQLNAIVGGTTFNASVLNIDFTPTGSTVQFSYVFGSEEYNEFVNSQFNDVFAFFVNGVNYALIPGTSTAVSINTVNNGFAGAGQLGSGPCTNCQYYVDNATGTRNTQLDGFTTVLSFVAPVNVGVSNTLKLAIADTSDRVLDSAVFIGGGSFEVCGTPGQPACGTTGTVPEPASLLLLGSGLALAYRRKYRMSKNN